MFFWLDLSSDLFSVFFIFRRLLCALDESEISHYCVTSAPGICTEGEVGVGHIIEQIGGEMRDDVLIEIFYGGEDTAIFYSLFGIRTGLLTGVTAPDYFIFDDDFFFVGREVSLFLSQR